MGSFSATSETAFTRPAEQLYDFVSDPENWPKTYSGSAGIEGLPTGRALRFGDTWTEIVEIGTEFSGRFIWCLTVAERPWHWEFRSVGPQATEPDGSGGLAGTTTISYRFSSPGADVTLFRRSITCELPKHLRMPDALLVASAQPAFIDEYHAAVERELSNGAA